ncbi:MAG TPA: DUF3592 domain-containing protein [Pseudomonadales bacterium]|nr:DUF3592 domain-containing protein [Pseudomonadales bacterium]
MNPSPVADSPRTLIRAAGLLLAFILVVAAAATYFNHLHRVALKDQGVRIQAVVVEVQRLGGKAKLTYLFQVNGTAYRVTRRTSLELNPGDPIEVIYLPSDPEINDLATALEAQ